MKRFNVVKMCAFMVAIAFLALAVCDGGSASAADKKFRIGVCTPNNKVPFFSRLTLGLQDQAAKFGDIALDIQDANDDTNTQINQVETFIAQNVDLIIMMPTQLEALIPVAKECNAAGIPFMTVNRLLTAKDSAKEVGVDMVTYVGADDYQGGRKQGELVKELLGDSGNIVLIQGTLGASFAVLRQQGLVDFLAENAPGIKVVDMQASGQDPNKAIAIMQNFMQSYGPGKIHAFVAQDVYSLISAADAVYEAGREDLYGKGIAFDYPQEVVDYIKAGKIYGSVIQSPYAQGVKAIEVAHQFLTKGPAGIAEKTFTDLPVASQKNVDQYSEPAW